MALLLILFSLVGAAVMRLWWVVWVAQPGALGVHRNGPMRVGVVLGSGGHTTEMMQLLAALPSTQWANNRPFYVVSVTDYHSAAVAQKFESHNYSRVASVRCIPRAREVRQSYLSSVSTTLRAFQHACQIVYEERPNVLLTNGPGVCVPVVLASVLLAAFAPWCVPRAYILYYESFTCVNHISLTGRILAPFLADVFTAHWHALIVKLRRWRWRGSLHYVGSGPTDSEGPPVALQPLLDDGETSSSPSRAKYAVITVGSTHFDSLVKAATTPEVCVSLRKRFGVTKLFVQHGTTPLRELGDASWEENSSEDGVYVTELEGLKMEFFPYRPNLSSVLRGATLVLTHAGAGTVLECLHAHRPTVVVPNEALMAGHQMELASALAERKFIFSVRVNELDDKLSSMNFEDLVAFPGLNVKAMGRVLEVPLMGAGLRAS